MRFKIHHKRKYHKSAILCICLLVFFAFMGVIIKKIEPDFWNRIESYALYNAEKAVNNAVNKIFGENKINYEDLINLSEDNNKSVSSLKVNTVQLNVLKAKLSDEIMNSINSREYGNITINMGTLYNSPLLSGIGPKIRINIYPSNQTIISFKDTFTQNGINQVKHTVYLDIKVCFTVTSATVQKKSEYNTSIPIADTVIVGDVPNLYGDSDLEMIGEEYESYTR